MVLNPEDMIADGDEIDWSEVDVEVFSDVDISTGGFMRVDDE